MVERVLANREDGVPLKEQAVLFRTSHHSAVLEAENPLDRVTAFRVLQLLPGIGPGTAGRLLARISHQGDDGERLCSNRAFSGLCWRSIDAIKRRFGRAGV